MLAREQRITMQLERFAGALASIAGSVAGIPLASLPPRRRPGRAVGPVVPERTAVERLSA